MKKYYVLFFVCIFSFWGCAFMTSPAIRVDNVIEKAGQQYMITEDVSVNVLGNRAQDIEEVFHDFGFSVVSNNADYTVRVETENLGYGYNYGYYVYPAKVRLRVVKNRTGQQFFYKADAEFRYYSGYSSYVRYPSDPYGIAAKVATTHAIGDFIEEQGIPHRWPKKK